MHPFFIIPIMIAIRVVIALFNPEPEPIVLEEYKVESYYVNEFGHEVVIPNEKNE